MKRGRALAIRGASFGLLPISERPLPVQTSEVLELHQAELDGALVSGIVTPGSRLRVYRGALVPRHSGFDSLTPA